jgi:hypothetical protein
MHFDRSALLAVARTRRAMQAERAADIDELERWFATEIALIRAEILEARAELAGLKALMGIETIAECHDRDALH